MERERERERRAGDDGRREALQEESKKSVSIVHTTYQTSRRCSSLFVPHSN